MWNVKLGSEGRVSPVNQRGHEQETGSQEMDVCLVLRCGWSRIAFAGTVVR